MTSVIVLIIDVCIVMILIGIFNILLFHAPVAILLVPLTILGGILIVWIVRKICLWDRDDNTGDTEGANQQQKGIAEKTASKK